RIHTSGPKPLIDMLRQKSRPYLFSNSLPPPVVASASKVFDIIMADNSLIAKLAANTKRFRSKMTAAGFTLTGKDHPISPVMLKEASLASKFADEMLKRDIYVIGFSFPVVPKGVQMGTCEVWLESESNCQPLHTEEEVDQCVDAFTEVGKQLGVV
ncbi:putative 2-amino-3-ketobutyrate coenzyme A ligase, mitochondrial-like, partial [Apostichopus japonicus]